MEQINLSAKTREVLGKRVQKLREAGTMPGVLYGHNVATTHIELNEREFNKAFKQAGESTIINLLVDGKQQPVLIHDVQHHYLNGQPIHVDFFAVNMTEKLTATIPVHFIGEAPAVKAMGGVLVKNLSEVQVECLPVDLPPFIEVDISSLNTFEDAIRVSELKVSDKVKVLNNAEDMVANVTAPRSDEEMAELEKAPVAEDVTKVEGVVKPEADAAPEGDAKAEKKAE